MEKKNIVRYLVEQGAEINKEDVKGLTPLFIASFREHENIEMYLIEHGASLNTNLKF